ncbi:polyprotein-like [Trifolium medium]|uniref:Polyprotein-like n=1 Tax=Trifolium medium TaxID=97028 RepID=A0A392M6N9_9FABA|nr:polyprotein-like [Trifolium medium]
MIAQNDSLQGLNGKMVKVTERIEEAEENLKVLSQKMQRYYKDLQAQISQLNHDLRTMSSEQLFGTTFNQKEKEMRNLKKQVKELDDIIKASKQSKEPQKKPIDNIFFNPPSFPTYFTIPERPPPFQLTSPFLTASLPEFMPSTYRARNIRATASISKDKGKAASLNESSPDSQDNPETPPSKYQKEEPDSQQPDQIYPSLAITNHYSPNDTSQNSTSSDNDQNYTESEDSSIIAAESEPEETVMNISELFMVNLKEESYYEESFDDERTTGKPKINGGPWFTFDDIPPNQRRRRLLDFKAWLDTHFMKADADPYKVIEEFCCRMTGSLKEWYQGLGEVSQDGLHRLENVPALLGIIHTEFIGDMDGHFSKNCPNNTEKASKLVNSLEPVEGDLESLYSEQSSADEETSFALQNSSSEDESLSSDEEYFPVFSLKMESILPTPPLPCVEIHILASKFAQPQRVIGYMDTGAQITMMNPKILPAEEWTEHTEFFMAANGKVFKT